MIIIYQTEATGGDWIKTNFRSKDDRYVNVVNLLYVLKNKHNSVYHTVTYTMKGGHIIIIIIFIASTTPLSPPTFSFCSRFHIVSDAILLFYYYIRVRDA